MLAKGDIERKEAEERFEELEKKFQKKLTKEAILSMMESGHLTIEEGEIELRDLESRKNKDNKTVKQQHPESKHAPIVPPMCRKNAQRPKQ